MKYHYIIPFVLGVLSFFAPAQADEVRLLNGDHISGTVARKEGETIIIQTSYAGEVGISWKEIEGIVTDRPATFVLSDETTIIGKALPTQKGMIRIKAGDILETAPINLKNIVYINPTLEVSGKGVVLHGKVNSGVTVSSGNTENQSVHLDAEMIARSTSNRYTLGAIYNEAEESDKKTASNTLGYMKYDHFFTKKWYALANSSFEKDKFKDIDLRSTIGLGAGYQFFESDRTNLFAEAGLNYVNFDYVAAEDTNYPAARWAIRYDTFFLKDMTQFFHLHELLFGLEDTSNVTFRSQTGFRIPLVQKINATLQMNLDWDNAPALNKKKTDKSYLFNLGYAW